MKSIVKPLSKDNISRELEQFDYEIVSIAYLGEDSSRKVPVLYSTATKSWLCWEVRPVDT